ncbi:hypothetical protein ACH5RR_028111 [Cinchona calisaya]|uniref:Homeobox-leucine zipper protein n=1 Tax=Cinchona calisaya TaxID=153742 RepID=A0ABD2YRF3_9GENT
MEDCRPLGFLIGLPFAFLALILSLVGAVIWVIGSAVSCVCPCCVCCAGLANLGCNFTPLFLLLLDIWASIKIFRCKETPNMGSNQKGHSLKHSKKRLSQDQVRLLEANFSSNKKLEPERKLQLAKQLGVPTRQIAIWYQNKRARWKNQSLELDYSAIQLRLETALAEKRLLEKHVEQLQVELHKTRETLLLANCTQHQQQQAVLQDHQVAPFSSFSSCGTDEGAGSSSLSLHEDVGCSWQNGAGQSLQLEELYACLMGSEG